MNEAKQMHDNLLKALHSIVPRTTYQHIRRFSRWFHHPAIHPHEWYSPLFQAAINHWPTNTPLYVALDTTALTPFLLIRASLIYRGRAIPLAWRVVQRETGSTQVRFEDYQPVLERVHLILYWQEDHLVGRSWFWTCTTDLLSLGT